jgi:hypothetical protein
MLIVLLVSRGPWISYTWFSGLTPLASCSVPNSFVRIPQNLQPEIAQTINKRKIIPKISNPPEFSAISSLQVSILTIRPLLQLIQVLPCRDQGLRCIQLFLLQVTLRLQGVRMVELH